MVSNQSHSLATLKNSLHIAQLLSHRVLLVLAGDSAVDLPHVIELLTEQLGVKTTNSSSLSECITSRQRLSNIVRLPDLHSNSDRADQINALLGSEFKCILFDANDAFDERLFAACAGTIIGGGILVLQTPSLDQWGEFGSASDNTSNFLFRIARKIAEHHTHVLFNSDSHVDRNSDNAALLIASTEETTNTPLTVLQTSDPESQSQSQFQSQPQPQSLPSLKTPSRSGQLTNTAESEWQAEQAQLVDQLVDNLLHNSDSTVVVQADRGRGKSALIGLAVRRLRATTSLSDINITMTASRQSACRVLLRHAHNTDASDTDEKVQSIRFVPVDIALKMQHDLLIVEEAGNIPIPVLVQMTQSSNRIVFATTVQGYEGAGRGFALRFAKQLNTIRPGWLKLQPTHPIRWSANDPLEAFVNDAFLLKSSLNPDVTRKSLTAQNAVVNQVSKQTLSTNDSVLDEIYALLIQAHYQTTPADLRNLIDKEQLLVFAQHTNHVLTGAALVALEGGIAPGLHDDIMSKERRLPDQLLPQLLAQSAAEKSVLNLNFSRIVRIAVHPQLQRRGYGTALFKAIREQLRPLNTTLGTSFGADSESVSFWLKLGLTPIHYGYKVNARSGVRSACLMLDGEQTAAPAIAKARSILHRNLAALLEQNKDDDPVGERLLQATDRPDNAVTTQTITSLLADFCECRRSFIDTVGLIELSAAVAPLNGVAEHIHNLTQRHRQLTPTQRRKAEQALREYLIKYYL